MPKSSANRKSTGRKLPTVTGDTLLDTVGTDPVLDRAAVAHDDNEPRHTRGSCHVCGRPLGKSCFPDDLGRGCCSPACADGGRRSEAPYHEVYLPAKGKVIRIRPNR
jgi:hypothetical protein